LTATAYPAEFEADVALRDGGTVQVRPVQAQDEDALRAFLEGLSDRSRWFRFFSQASDLSRAAHDAADVDYRDRFGLVALAGPEPTVVGHAQYVRSGPEQAEIAFAVADSHQGHGLGTVLLAHLAARAHASGIEVLEADVLAENRRMLEVFRESGFPVRTKTSQGTSHLELPCSLSPEAVERFEARERVAAVAAVRRVLEPASVAVIGASRHRGTVGGELLHNLLAGGFAGPVFPVNPSATKVQGVPAFAGVDAIPGRIDLAIVAVPAAHVLDVARACARNEVGALVVVSAGFAEVGKAGAVRQEELVGICRSAGMRLVGPNCLGVLNTAVGLDATFAPGVPTAGKVGFLSQSGALGLSIIERAAGLGLGLSSFVSAGNKADLSGNDFLQYWEQDGATDLVLLYLESFGNPRRFARVARRVSRVKPIIAVKSGRSRAGARAASSHTGALVASSDVSVDALFEQAGVIRTDTLGELFDTATLMTRQPLPRGRRVAILTNAGGPGIMCADACEAEGLELPALPAPVRDALAGFLPSEASLRNPIDMIASAQARDYERALEVLARSGAYDAVIAIFIRPLATRTADVVRALEGASRRACGDVPVLAVMMSELEAPVGEGAVPRYRFPEEAVRALTHAARYRAWRDRPDDPPADLGGVRRERAAHLLGAAAAGGARWLEPQEVAEVLGCYGLPMVESRDAATAHEAGSVADELGGTVALKAVATTLVHKSDAGGVTLGLEGGDAVAEAADEMATRLGAAGHESVTFLVQQMVSAGVEMLVGVTNDEQFGPLVACGAGGVTAELQRDVVVRLPPLSEREASEMVRSLRCYPLLDGYRRAPRADRAALEDVVVRIAALTETHPEVLELDCNPVIVSPDGAHIVDARVRVAPQPPVKPWPSLPNAAA
jgi:acetyl coenzyme A synthetase (ADP forming)-like protein